MPPPSPLPTHVWKIVPEDPGFLEEGLPVSELDKNDGFIHLSTAEQVPQTVDRFFGFTIIVYLLKIPLAKIQSKVKWEDAGPGCFPHLFEPNGDLSRSLNSNNVEAVIKCERHPGEDWVGVVERSLREQA